jgi:DNA modification methylase
VRSRVERIGDAIVICGSYPQIAPALGAHRFAVVSADPPYGAVLKETRWELPAGQALKLYRMILDNAKASLKPGGSLLLWGGVGKPRRRVLLRAVLYGESVGWDMRNWITWRKKRAYGKSNDYLFTREELIWFVRSGESPRIFNVPLLDEKRGYPGYNSKYPAKSEYKRRTNVWTDITEIMRGKTHEAEKPERLYEVLYATHSRPGDYVLDLCAGSGAAGAAALKLGRRPVLVEKDPEAFEQICERLRTA